jgi:hypothetical protein
VTFPVTTTYLGHRISIEPFEWGYLTHIAEPGSDRHLIAANASALRALEAAFEAIDRHLASPAEGSTASRSP